MSVKTWQLPWSGEMVPHAVLDILRDCNISCRACYNVSPPGTPKTLDQVTTELNELMKLRRLGSVSILGGEVTLHPQMYDIVRMIREKGLFVEMFTNGLMVDQAVCRRLKEAGLNVICFHIEKGQTRPDLPKHHSAEDINNLRLQKVVMAGKEGLDVGLTTTAYPGETDDIRDIVSLTLKTPEINYLLITLFRDNSGVKSLQGDIVNGFSGTGSPPCESKIQDNNYFADWMRKSYGVEPFSCMGSNLNVKDPRWLSYLVGTVYEANGTHHFEHIAPSMLEKSAMVFFRMIGRFPMYMEQNPGRFRKQLLLNGLLGGRRQSNMELVRRSRRKGARLTAKRLLFQNPAELTTDGRLIHCKWCPDAVLKNNALVPVCIADHVA